MSSAAPIGVFDSGFGGLSVAREIRALLPHERIVYFADTAYCPYGGRPLREICARSLRVGEELLAHGAKLIVVACNSASGAALEALREAVDVPVVGLEPAVKPATEQTRSGRVGVLATEATLGSERFQRLVESFADGVQVLPRACPGLVELVEAGELDGARAEQALRDILRPLQDAGADALVLGCTHYPFLRPLLARLAGPDVRILDSGAAVARQTERVLHDAHALAETGPGGILLLTSGDPAAVRPIAERLWGEPLEVRGVEEERV